MTDELANPTDICGTTLAVIGKAHFGNPIPKEWYSAANELMGRVKPKPTPVAVPEGWQLVPKEPTPEMLRTGEIALDSEIRCERDCYTAMLDAAPQPPTPVLDLEAIRKVILSINDHTMFIGSVESNWGEKLARAIGDKP